MTAPLWTLDALVAASGGRLDAAGAPIDSGGIGSISIDTRSLRPGALFVALKDQRDGHEFVPAAFAAGASAALVSETYARQPGDGALLRVDDPLRALERIASAARARLAREARIIAITGSAGKTTTKEMLRVCLSPLGATHASAKSFNNHWGVPLTLASMPAATRYAVLEIGMNHSGEITPLTRLARPHVAIVTNVHAVHLGQFASVDEIAAAKAEIFAGLDVSGTGILNADLPPAHVARLRSAVEASGARVVTFGARESADVRLADMALGEAGSTARASVAGRDAAFRVGAPGRHLVMNAVAVLAALDAIGIADLDAAMRPLAGLGAGDGRGRRTVHGIDGGRLMLIDESYNANPESMRVALSAMALMPRARYSRRVAVLGDMLELGPQAADFHRGLKETAESCADVVYTAGPMMRVLHDALAPGRGALWAPTARELEAELIAGLRPGDVVMVKGSNGSRMAALTAAIKARYPEVAESA
ncbi:MAG: UDP-N-acetylmuramoyl-tripeptide--D-alanyl-D-alanine ligase [Hyphomicrobiaceae bacterium]